MATFGAEDIEKTCRESARVLGYSTLRDQQLRVITDVFAVLPAGYGKALLLLTSLISEYSACAMYTSL